MALNSIQLSTVLETHKEGVQNGQSGTHVLDTSRMVVSHTRIDESHVDPVRDRHMNDKRDLLEDVPRDPRERTWTNKVHKGEGQVPSGSRKMVLKWSLWGHNARP